MLLHITTLSAIDLDNYLVFIDECGQTYPNITTIKKLIKNKNVDPTLDNNYAIRTACERNNDAVVKLLLKYPNINPAANGNEAIQTATRYGHTKIVKLLLDSKLVDASVDNNWSLRTAHAFKYTNIMKLLLNEKSVLQRLSVKSILTRKIVNILKEKYDFINNRNDAVTFIQLQ